MERLKDHYLKKVVPALKSEFGLKNSMEVPKITKILVNAGVGKFKEDKKKVDAVVADLAKITGQAPVQNRARMSISGFKVREGQVVGVSVTLRGHRMFSFLDKLINVALPRVRDFQGVASNFDGRGNFNLGLREHLVFPEISASALDNVFGLEVSIVTNAGRDDRARALLSHLGFPFKK